MLLQKNLVVYTFVCEANSKANLILVLKCLFAHPVREEKLPRELSHQL